MKMNEMLQNKDYSISCARFIAMCFIVVCHMMQRDDFASDINGAHIRWAFWFNIGVQMFLFISGFLYGKKESIDTVSFFKRAFPKILVDYYIFIIVMLIAIYFSPSYNISVDGAVKLLTFSGTVPGLGHLWFVPTILFCYLLTPIISEIVKAIDKRSNLRFWIETLLFLIIVQKIIKLFFKSFTPAWITCYIIGMIYSKISSREPRNRTVFDAIVIIMCLLIVPIQFRIDYWPHGDLPSPFVALYRTFTNYGHVFLGIEVVLLIRYIYGKIENKSKNHSILNLSDKYSYDVYLVHHVFVQSAFGCVEYITNRFFALPLAVLLTIVSAIFLYYVSDFVRTRLTTTLKKLPN